MMADILYTNPWAPDKCFGRAINDLFRRTDFEWICLLDADTMFTTKTFDAQIRQAIAENPDARLFTCLVNRNGYMNTSRSQMAPDVDPYNEDMAYHHHVGQQLQQANGSRIEMLSIEFPLTGAMMLLHRQLWQLLELPETPGILGTDNYIHRQSHAHGHPCYVLQGVYMYHWYRGGFRHHNEHLKVQGQ